MNSCALCKQNNSYTYMKSNAWNNRDGIELRKCKDCRFVFSSEFTCDYTIVGKQVLGLTKEDVMQSAQKERYPQLVDEIVQKTGLQSGKALDFGCGVGIGALCLQQKGFTAYGVEQSEAFLTKHKEFNIISAASLQALGVEKESFDIIVMKDVLEHVDKPVELLREVLSYLKPSGYFYIRVPNVYHYSFHWSIDTKSHVNHFSPAHLTKLLKQNQMNITDFIGVYDISTQVGKAYNLIFWNLKKVIPMYHQISLLCQKEVL